MRGLRVLREANEVVRRKWRNTGRGWKIALVVGLIIAGVLGVITTGLYLAGRLIKALTIGGFRNRSLYIPSVGRRGRF